MSVLFDAASTADTTGAAATSFSNATNMTVGASANLLVVLIAWSSTAPTGISITWNGVALTQVSGAAHANGTAGNTDIWALVNPAAGTKTLAGSWTGTRDFYVAAVSFSGANNSSVASAFKNGNFAISTSASLSASDATTIGGANVAIGAAAATINSVTSGTQVFLDNTQTAKAVGFRLVGSGSNQNFTAGLAASAAWVISFAEIVQAPPFVNAASDYSNRWGRNDLPAPEQPYNQRLYQVVIPPSPRNQFDYPRPFGVLKSRVPEQPYNQNLYSVTVSVFVPEPVVTKLPSFPRVPPPVQAHNPNLYTVAAQLPFNQTDFPKVFDIRQTPLTDQALNINLFSNAFPNNQYDFPKVLDIRQAPFSPDQALNINLFTNPFPFDQYDWSKPIRIKQAPFSPTDPLNINVFTNPIPILNLDLDTQVRLRPVVDSSQPYNLNLYGIVVVTVPFNQVDFAKPFVPRPAAILDQTFNPSVFTNPFPFNQYDYLKPLKVPQSPIDRSFQLNQNLINLFPINQYDYLKPVKVPQAPIVVDQALNINVFTNLYPFTQTDWSKPVRLPRAPFFPHEALNPNVFTNPYPFNQLPWTSTFNVPQAKLSEQPYNQSLLSVTVVLMGQAWM